MDPITHGLLGAVTTQSFFSQRLKRKAWLLGAVAAMAPDLDIFIHSANQPLLGIVFHRNFTHSLLFIPFGGLFVALIFLLVFKSLRAQWKFVIAAAIIAYATHGFLDACTSYGTQLLWPFSNARIAWDTIAIVDPVITVILLIGVVWSAIKIRARPALIALILALLYLLFGAWQHHRAMIAQVQIAQQRNEYVIQGRAMPEIATLFSWRSFYVADDQIHIDQLRVPLVKQVKYLDNAVVPRFTENELPFPFEYDPDLVKTFEIFNWFADDYVSVFSWDPLILVDARYLQAGDPPNAFWGIEFTDDVLEEGVRWVHHIPLIVNSDHG
jgi:inner membrane protein